MRNKIILIALIIIIAILFFAKNSNPSHKEIIINQNSTILAFGDSITYGFGAKENESYPDYLSKFLHVKIINAGINGEDSNGALKRLPKVIQDTQPSIVILCIGGNDILRKYDLEVTKKNIEQMVEIIEQNNAVVVLIGVPKLNGFIISTASLYDEIAKKYNLVYDRNIINKIIKTPSLKADQVHPNSEGYRVLAQAIYDLLESSFTIK